MSELNDPRLKAFKRLLDIMDDLRAKCPWDKKQTFESLSQLTIEETFELNDAIYDQNIGHIEEEIGDLFLHLVFYAKLGQEAGAFDVTSILTKIAQKLIHRHPHIYSDTVANSEEEVKKNWEKIKLKEGRKSLLEGVPRSLPGITKAYRIQEKVKQVGFEWENKEQVWEKVVEETAELQEAIAQNDDQQIEEEFGDLLFALINYARFLQIDPEAALQKTNKKFIERFQYIENNATKRLEDMTLEEMEYLWQKAKNQ
jgi:XTP/dITP diphosphohydrolase